MLRQQFKYCGTFENIIGQLCVMIQAQKAHAKLSLNQQ